MKRDATSHADEDASIEPSSMLTEQEERTTDDAERWFIQSLARGLEVIANFTAASPSQSISSLSTRTGLARATVRRVLFTLHKLGYLKYEKQAGTFSLTGKILGLSDGYSRTIPNSEQILSIMRDLATSGR
ncbi:hypothetical protein CDEF62S_05371 [Castellaniella defragrans]